jgi:hypothetical protein
MSEVFVVMVSTTFLRVSASSNRDLRTALALVDASFATECASQPECI